MALSITSNYTGESAIDIITPSILEGKSISENYVTVWSNIKDKFNLPVGDSTVNIQAYACDTTASGSFTISEKVLDLNKFQVYDEICYDTLRATFESKLMKSGTLNDAEGTSNITKFIQDEIIKKTNKAIEVGIWSGALAAPIEGFHALAVADPLCTELLGVAITKANVLVELDRVIDAIPDAILDEAKVFIPRGVARKFMSALPEEFPYSFNIQDKQSLVYRGINLYVVDLAANKMLAGKSSSFHLGTDLTSDFNQFKSDFKAANSDTVFYKLQFKIDTQITSPAEIVVYN